MATLCQSSLQVPFFQEHLLTCLCHVLIILILQIFSLLLYLLYWSVISDLWCYQTTCWRLRWWSALSLKYFLIKCIVFLIQCCYTLSRPQYSVNIIFICTGKQKNLCNLLYCDNCFTAMVKNQNWTISELCWYLKLLFYKDERIRLIPATP